jgi:DoxX-like family
MTTIDAFLIRATERPATTTWEAAGMILPYALAAYIAYILLWYLPFKFYPDSYLFQVLEDAVGPPWFEPYFRYFTGGVEAATCLLLVVPGLQVAGAAVAFATMAGAIGFHLLTPLGVDPYNDGGTLFKEACTNLVFSAAILAIRRHEILPLLRYLVTDPRFGRFPRVSA